jgi:hypothetical protein
VPPGPLIWLQRGLLTLSQVALLLPFVMVQDCASQEAQVLSGVQVYGQTPGLVGLGLLQGALALVLLGAPWRAGVASAAARAAGLGLRASLAIVGAGVAVLVPGVAFLFDHVLPRVGWPLHAGAWGVLGLAYVGGCLDGAWRQGRGPVAAPEGAAAVGILVVPVLAGFWMLARGQQDAEAGLVGPVVGLPLALAARGVGALAAEDPKAARGWRVALWGCALAWSALWMSAALG